MAELYSDRVKEAKLNEGQIKPTDSIGKLFLAVGCVSLILNAIYVLSIEPRHRLIVISALGLITLGALLIFSAYKQRKLIQNADALSDSVGAERL